MSENTEFENLRKEISGFAGQYLSALVSQIGVLLDECQRQGVSLLILPEYSVPWQALGRVQAEAARRGIGMIAGSHALRNPIPDDYPFKEEVLRRTGEDWSHCAVSPSFGGIGSESHLTIKQVPSRYEPEFNEVPDLERRLIEFQLQGPDAIQLNQVAKVCVVICSEFLVAPELRESGTRLSISPSMPT